MTFNEGDQVIHKSKLDRGTVLEVADGIAYLEMDNLVEMDFPLSDLVLESEYKSPADLEKEVMDLKSDANKKLAEVIWPKIRPVLANMTSVYALSAEAAVGILGGEATPWEELTAYHKMNFLCIWTKTKFEDWVDAADVGKLGDVQLAIMTQIGLELTK